MTENEAMKRMEMCIGISPSENIMSAFKLISEALEEVQQYRAIGTVEECREAMERMKQRTEINKAIMQYIEDGTIKHDLKISPEYFKDVVIGKKTFELRKNDRDFQIGDNFILREWDGHEYTGKYFINSIGYVLKNCKKYGLMDAYCIFGW